MSDKIIEKIHSTTTLAAYIKLIAWIIFLTIFGPFFIFTGLYIGSLFLSLLGLFLTYFIFWRSFLNFDSNIQQSIAKFFFIEHVLVALVSLYMIFLVPIDGNWTRMDRTENWYGPVVINYGPDHFAVSCSNDNWENVYVTKNSGINWIDIKYPEGYSTEMGYNRKSNDLWIGPRDYTVIYKYNTKKLIPKKNNWKSSIRPPGKLQSLIVTEENSYLLTEGKLFIYNEIHDSWNRFTYTSDSIRDIAVSRDIDNPMILIISKDWLQSTDGGKKWKDVKPKGIALAEYRTEIGGRWRYVYENGMFSSKLYVGEPGKDFIKRDVPVSDINTLVVNPENGKEVWIGSNGQGIYWSIDGGKKWIYQGLRGIGVRSMAVDFKKGRVIAASSNDIFKKGLYTKEYLIY